MAERCNARWQLWSASYSCDSTDSNLYPLSTSVGFLFPVYSSYKAIRANEQDAIESWLMYWVVMAGLHAVENTVEWAVNWCVMHAVVMRCSC